MPFKVYIQTKIDRLNEKLAQKESSQKIQTCFIHETAADLKDTICIFCNQPPVDEGWWLIYCFCIWDWQQYAVDFQDTVLLTKLATGDMIALEAKYH